MFTINFLDPSIGGPVLEPLNSEHPLPVPAVGDNLSFPGSPTFRVERPHFNFLPTSDGKVQCSVNLGCRRLGAHADLAAGE